MDVHKLVTAHYLPIAKTGGIVVDKQKKGLFVGRSLNCNSGSTQKYRSLLTVLHGVHQSPTLGDIFLCVMAGDWRSFRQACVCVSEKHRGFGQGESLFPDTI